MMNLGRDREDRHPHVIAIVDKIKSEGIFDALRKECLADADTKPAYQNLRQKVENACASFLSRIVWSAQLNKNHLREQMRKNLEDSGVLQSGVKRIVNQVVTPRIDGEVKPKVAQVVCEYLGLDPDDIHTEDDEEGIDETGAGQDYSQGPGAPVGLYPFNPLEPPLQSGGPTSLPGFDEYEKYPSHAPPPPDTSQVGGNSQPSTVQEVRFEEPQTKAMDDDKTTDKQDDMDISDKSDSRSTSRASTKKSMDMDCTMTSDEESGGGMDGTDLTKGLAAYMAGNDTVKNDDDMSISSGTSSKQEETTHEPAEEVAGSTAKSSTTASQEKKQKNKESSTPGDKGRRAPPPPVERREMKRQRTRNKKYMSDDFESIFTEKRELMSDAYSHQDIVEEEVITTDDMMSQVIVEEAQSASPSSEHPVASTRSSQNAEKSKTAGHDDSIEGVKPRRSSRRRGTREVTPPPPPPASALSLPSVTVSIEDIANIKLPEGLPVKTTAEIRKALRSSRSVGAAEEPLVPRRYTRSSAKHVSSSPPAESPGAGHSPSSTSARDESVTAAAEAMVVLSDICAGLNRLSAPVTGDTPTADAREGSVTPTLDEQSMGIADWMVVDEVKSTIDSQTESPRQLAESPGAPAGPSQLADSAGPAEGSTTNLVDQSMSKSEQFSESYEPELHFEEMSRAVTDQADLSPSRSDAGTPTLDEPVSPDRLTESPTSPTPSSPTEMHSPEISASMVTIPLEGEDSYHSVSEEPFHNSQPSAGIPTIPTEWTVTELGVEPPPLPPDQPPLPTEFGDNSVLPPPEPVLPPPEPQDDEEDEDAVFQVLSEVGVDDGGASPVEADGELAEEEGKVPPPELEAEDLEELERLAQRKMEILKAIELPDSMLERTVRTPSSEEEGEISDSSEEERKSKKKKSKKSKKKKNKKESRKRKHHDLELGNSSKRSRHY